MAALLQGLARRVSAALAGEPADNHGVPGDWVTGDRVLDITLLPIVWAFGFVLLRRLMRVHVFEVRTAERRSLRARGAAGCMQCRSVRRPAGQLPVCVR